MSKLQVKYFVDGVSKSSILNLDGVKTVGDLRKQLTQLYKESSFDLVCCGNCLQDDQTLDSLNLDECSVVYVVKSSKVHIPDAETIDTQTFNQIMKTLKHIFHDAQSRHWVEDKLKDAKLIEYIIEAVPAFGSDPVAINILTDRHLLWKSLGSKKRAEAEKTLSEHPSLGYAIIILHGALNDDWSQKANFQYKDARALYNIDHMSDDEADEEDDDDMETDANERQRRSNGNNPFSRLMGTQAFGQPYGNNSTQSTSGSTQQNLITPDFFRQAMMFASGMQSQQQPAAAASAPTPSHHVDPGLIEIQLQHLREMGIMDEEQARRVLMETGGDLQATIEILFSGDAF